MNDSVHAPYNFVPFSNRILFPYDSMEELPSHGTWEPGLKTGKILISMKAETPVFVSNGEDDPQFFRTPGGDRALPGSTVRGMVRENMQILGFGLVQKEEDLDDSRLFFRALADARDSTGKRLQKYYNDSVLDTQTVTSESGKSYRAPKNVHAGYLRKDGDTYRIIPTQGPYFRVSRQEEMVTEIFSVDELKMDAQTIGVFYQNKGDKVTALRRADKPAPRSGDWKHGVLLFTGSPIETNPLYLFPDPDLEAAIIQMKEDDENVLAYAEDWKRRQNVLKPDKNFWKLPEDGEQKPVFYTDYDGHIYWGMSLFLRVGYPYSLAHGLPQPHQKAAETQKVDYPHAILGFVKGKSAYRSRVSFGDLLAVGDVKECKPVSMILGEPKPSYYPGYAYGSVTGNDNAVRHYADKNFLLRGYKLYWHKREAKVEPSEAPDGKERVGTTLRPLDKDTVFRGVIRFKNLTPEELGLLLWSLRLDEDCFQSVGMGKPYGYGRMKLEIEGLTEYTPEDLYDGTLTARGTAKGRDAVNEYIRVYDQAACEALPVKPQEDTGEVSIRNRPEIKDFFYMKRKLQGPEFTYMKLGEFKNNRLPLPKAAEFREEDEKKARRAAEEAAKPTDMAAMLQQLAAQKNGGVGGAGGSPSGGGTNKNKNKGKGKGKRNK